MKKLLKILLFSFILILIGLGSLLSYVKFMLPSVGDAPFMKIESSVAKIQRGKYLANHVTVCIDCHSKRNWDLFSGPLVEGSLGSGGEVFDQKLGFPGEYVANNLTPAHLGNWTDGEIFRAITSGVSKDGKALFSIMAYHNFGLLDKEDIESIIAYLRTLPSIENKTVASSSDFPMNFIINTLPKKPSFSKIPSVSDSINYGKYLVTAAGCCDCHTNQVKGKFIGEPFAGGFKFKFPGGSSVTSSNITPHATGIGNWTEKQFVDHFKSFVDSNNISIKTSVGEFQTVMPWTMYGGMADQDISAIFKYLKTQKPINNIVNRFSPAQK